VARAQRAAHYQHEAEKFRRMAEAEPIERLRIQLLNVAQQYQELADALVERSSVGEPA
jgi:hypothetical protein